MCRRRARKYTRTNFYSKIYQFNVTNAEKRLKLRRAPVVPFYRITINTNKTTKITADYYYIMPVRLDLHEVVHVLSIILYRLSVVGTGDTPASYTYFRDKTIEIVETSDLHFFFFFSSESWVPIFVFANRTYSSTRKWKTTSTKHCVSD